MVDKLEAVMAYVPSGCIVPKWSAKMSVTVSFGCHAESDSPKAETPVK